MREGYVFTGVCLSIGGRRTPLWANIPLGRHPLCRHPPADTPSRHPPTDTPWTDTPGQTPPWRVWTYELSFSLKKNVTSMVLTMWGGGDTQTLLDGKKENWTSCTHRWWGWKTFPISSSSRVLVLPLVLYLATWWNFHYLIFTIVWIDTLPLHSYSTSRYLKVPWHGSSNILFFAFTWIVKISDSWFNSLALNKCYYGHCP